MTECKRVAAGIFSFLVVTVLLSVLVGCTDRQQEGKTVVRFVSWKPNVPEAWEEILDTFHRENPDIRIEREIGPHSSTAFHDLLTQKLKNRSTDVDVFLMDVIWPPEFGAAGWAEPLDERMSREERAKFMDGSLLANTYEGELYGIPLFIDSGVLYYRKDLLNKYRIEVPETWQQMVAGAQHIVSVEEKEGNQIYGFSGQFKQYEGLVCDMQEYILSNGGRILDPEEKQSVLHLRPAVEAVRFVRDAIINGIAPAGVLNYQEPESLDLFVQGRAVFHRNWPYAWEISNNPGKSKIAGKVGIAKLPHFPGKKSYATLGGWQLGISRYSNQKEAAWRFVQFLSGERMQKVLALKAGRAPTRKVLYDDREVIASYPHFREMKGVFLTAYPRPRSPLYPAVSHELQRYFSRAISSPGTDIEGEAEKASREIDRILSLVQ